MYPIATISVLFDDVQHALPLVIFTLFYITPIFYPVKMVPEILRSFYFMNPFAGLGHWDDVAVYEGHWPVVNPDRNYFWRGNHQLSYWVYGF